MDSSHGSDFLVQAREARDARARERPRGQEFISPMRWLRSSFWKLENPRWINFITWEISRSLGVGSFCRDSHIHTTRTMGEPFYFCARLVRKEVHEDYPFKSSTSHSLVTHFCSYQPTDFYIWSRQWKLISGLKKKGVICADRALLQLEGKMW